MAREQQVRIEVYDMLGRIVVTLVDGPQAAGTHQVQFGATGLPSGLYLYRIDASHFTEVRRMVLVK